MGALGPRFECRWLTRLRAYSEKSMRLRSFERYSFSWARAMEKTRLRLSSKISRERGSGR
jgi:hypothetical protein